MDFEINYPDRKGSLSLRSTHKTYGRPVLVCNWYQHREAEPKDYDVDTIPEGQTKNLHRSTYKRFLSLPEGDWSTTTESYMSQINLKDDYQLRERKPLMAQKTLTKEFFKRTSDCPETKHNEVLPRHPPEHSKMYLETTYNYDYMPPYHYIPNPPEVPKEDGDYRLCQSQFVDTDDHRRHGRNTWMDESGIYANSELKKVLFPPSNPIATRLK
ncbi:cilia- and flagella-associated protein 95-like [Heterodontus francisci]|uniref:cilia- and flagella-associated protein 95-like n=1 Tax=Heterodontus francisci TaxID=7792 RepID=UPI00355B4D75